MLFNAVLALEALDTARCIDQALLPGVKRMTVRADFNVNLA